MHAGLPLAQVGAVAEVAARTTAMSERNSPEPTMPIKKANLCFCQISHFWSTPASTEYASCTL